MGKQLSALFLAALAVCAFAAQTPFEKFLSSAIEPDWQFSHRTVQGNGNFSIVSIAGNETYLVEVASGKAVADEQQLLSLLTHDAKNRSAFAQRASFAVSLGQEIMDAKLESEQKCMQYTGVAAHPCNDRESCIIACYAVPLCGGESGGGGVLHSDGFVEALLEWNEKRLEFDGLVAEYSDGIEGAVEDAGLADQKVALLERLSIAAANLSANPMFLNRSDEGCTGQNATRRCYDFCPDIDYSLLRLSEGKGNLLALKSAVLELQKQAARADEILARGKANDAYLASRGRDYEEFRLLMGNSQRELDESALMLAKRVADPQVGALEESLAEFSEQISAYADRGMYRTALSKKEQYLQKLKAANDRIAYGFASLDSLYIQLAAIEKRIDRGEWLLGNQSAQEYRDKAGGINKSVKLPSTLPQIASAGSAAEALAFELDSELSAKATEEEMLAEGGDDISIRVPAGIPKCLPAMAIALALLFAAATPGRSLK